MEYITLRNGMSVPKLGMGTWYLGENLSAREEEIHALQTGIQNGMTLIDTAEMYGNGHSEQLVGQAVRDYDRKELFLVSKVLPQNAGENRLRRSLNHTLRMMRTNYLDLYLLHWRGSIPLAETVRCMEEMVEEGKIRAWGVSNFDTDDMKELFGIPGGEHCAVNQVLYHLGSRGIEYSLKPWMDARGVALMAYCPLAQAGMLRQELLNHPVLDRIAGARRITVSQLLLAFVLHRENTIAIPRSGKAVHVQANADAMKVRLSKEELIEIDRAFPAPDHKSCLDIV